MTQAMTRVAMAHRSRRRAFSLAELLVAMAIIAIIAAVTVVAIGAISRDARISSGINTVVAALDNARALAMKNGRPVMLVFRPRMDGNEQYLELVMAESAGTLGTTADGFLSQVEMFQAIPDVQARQLPAGINVAAPRYGEGYDDRWTTQPNLRSSATAGEGRGSMLVVMFNRDGTVITRNPETDANRQWVDFNPSESVAPPLPTQSGVYTYPDNPAPDLYFDQFDELDEPFVTHAVFLSVYDDAEGRELKASNWTGDAGYDQDLTGATGFISSFGERLHFNRFTGVVMR